ncbi:hypothetical protein KQI42_08000 [Tissierella sp. MSJ-40]|uniref:Uncharacterized protein n=1 Tax=Tissierella simiarum TaxID=2841534 RepID=A0ABS6E5Y3_9FIRM|nr:DUF6512 family protein [Tissierella simiarum]MBU5437946.1 hypothetical protein [Tissierella simiarum]
MYKDEGKVTKWEVAGIFWIVIVGSLLHFTYDWSGKLTIIGMFSPINESVWEHLKLGYWSLVFFTIIEYWFIRKHTTGFFWAKFLGIFTMELFIILFFYTYTFFTKKEILFLDILSFIIGAILCQFISMKIMKKRVSYRLNIIGLLLFTLLGLSLIYFTFYPLKLPIFMDSNNGSYGID